MFDDPQVQYDQVTPWRFYNYAILHSGGIGHVFDTMRYDSAHFLRQADVDRLIASANSECDFVTQQFSILLCRRSEKGVTKPGWTHQRLLSDQEFEEINDPSKLYDLYPGFSSFHAKPPLKWEATCEIKGNLAYVLQTMLLNRAVPADEGMAHKIEQMFYHPNEEATVKLKNWLPTQSLWTFPKRPEEQTNG